MFWITQLCRRKRSGYFPPFADSVAFCPIIPWHELGLVHARFGGFGLPETGSPLFEKHNTQTISLDNTCMVKCMVK